MSQKRGLPYNLILALVFLIGLGGVLAVSSNVKVSVIGSVIIVVAVLESAVILRSIALLNRRQPHPETAGDSN